MISHSNIGVLSLGLLAWLAGCGEAQGPQIDAARPPAQELTGQGSSALTSTPYTTAGYLFHHDGYDYAPSVMSTPTTQQFWWCGVDRAFSQDTIYTSTWRNDGRGWTPTEVALQPQAGSNAWDATEYNLGAFSGACDPTVVMGSWTVATTESPSDTYAYAMYFGDMTTLVGDGSIGVAFSHDGVHFVEYAENPILRPAANQYGDHPDSYGAGQAVAWNYDGASGVLLTYTDQGPDARGVQENYMYTLQLPDGVHPNWPRTQVPATGLPTRHDRCQDDLPNCTSGWATQPNDGWVWNADFAPDPSGTTMYAAIPRPGRSGGSCLTDSDCGNLNPGQCTPVPQQFGCTNTGKPCTGDWDCFGGQCLLGVPTGVCSDRDTSGFTVASMPVADFVGGGGTWTVLGSIDSSLTGYYIHSSPGLSKGTHGEAVGLPTLSVYFGAGTDDPDTWDLTWASVNAASSDASAVVPLRLYTAASGWTLATTGYVPPGYSAAGSAGLLLKSPQPGTVPVYQCCAPLASNGACNTNDPTTKRMAPPPGSVINFLSSDSACNKDGGSWSRNHNDGLLGYIYSSSQPGTSRVVQCYRDNGDHFVSSDVSCAGAHLAWTLGWARPESLSIGSFLDDCGEWTKCTSCTAASRCGWDGIARTCRTGDASGPSWATTSQWAWTMNQCN